MRFPIRRWLMAGMICALMAGTPRAGAWCFKEHIQFVRIAAERLMLDPTAPTEMKAWLARTASPRLDAAGEEDYFLHRHIGSDANQYGGTLHWVVVPDVRQLADHNNVAEFPAPESKMHFMQLEVFLPGDAEKKYRDDLSGKPRFGDIPHDAKDARFVQAGFLPLRVEQCYREFVRCIRENKLEPTSDTDEDNAVKWGGFLAHYVADTTQPHHSTIDNKSLTYFADKRDAANVHMQMEPELCDSVKGEYPALRREYWPIFVRDLETVVDPASSDDPFTGTVQVSMFSYDALPLIGRAAMAAQGQGGTPEHPVGKAKPADQFDTVVFFHYRGMLRGSESSVMEMKAYQTALAVRRIERIWKQAWIEAKAGN